MRSIYGTPVLNDEILAALAHLQDLEPTEIKEDTEELTDILMEVIENQTTTEYRTKAYTLMSNFRYYSRIIRGLYPKEQREGVG